MLVKSKFLSVMRPGKVANTINRVLNRLRLSTLRTLEQNALKRPRRVSYGKYLRHYEQTHLKTHEYPVVLPNWDNTSRSGVRGYLLSNSTPALFRKMLHKAVSDVSSRPDDERIIFLESWNEWAERNRLEPCRDEGDEILAVVRDELTEESG